MFRIKTFSFFIVSFIWMYTAYAQNVPGTMDTTKATQLQEVIVKAYVQNRQLRDVPAAVNVVNQRVFQQFSPTSIVSAVNTTPGIHMEERSPGSYRFNIRGSSLRSPFGVRNVKIYFNDIPITDPGGNTYLNQLGYYNFNSIEIIKGPASSLYGAGTGGAMLIESNSGNEPNGVNLAYTSGSYHLQQLYGSIATGNDSAKNIISYQHQQNDGYRQHAALRRDVVTWYGQYTFNQRQQLKTTLLYGDLQYQTPGALTLAEYTKNPRSARPSVGGFPGAETNKATVYQKTLIAGLSYTQYWGLRFQNTSVAYGAFTDFKNATIRNYSKNVEPHAGGRTTFKYHVPLNEGQLSFDAGAEWQQNFTTVNVYGNKLGEADTLQTNDDIPTRQSLLFLQSTLEWHHWVITAGASINRLIVRFHRYYPTIIKEQERKFNNELAPRIAVLKKWSSFSIYSSIAKGFSPPTTSELVPSGSAVNLGLEAEEGLNYDIGARATLFHKLYVDVNAFWFTLRNTIVQRRDIGGGDYFINAGKTAQHGIETYINYSLFTNTNAIRSGNIWVSHSWHHFRYKRFQQLNNDFTGNRLPAEPLHTLGAGVAIITHTGLSGNINYYYADKIPLNDANTEYTKSYHLVGIKVSYNIPIHQSSIQLMAGVENLLDETYSLGNDINAFGGRYYNVAPGRNYYAGLQIHLGMKRLNNGAIN